MKKTKVISLLYHEVTNNPNDSGFQRKNALPYKHSVKDFSTHLFEINKFKNNVTTFNKIREGEKNILLTFDDGGKSNMLIADMLDELNFKGHFFISTSYIGKPHFLNKENILDLHKRGHVIGSHSHTHPNVYRSLTSAQMNEEWLVSKNILCSILNAEIECCSIPGGDASFLCYETAFKSGFNYIFNSEPKVDIEYHEKLFVFGRVSLKKNDSLNKLKNTLKLKDLNKLMFLRQLKVFIKTLIFPIYSKIHNSRNHEA